MRIVLDPERCTGHGRCYTLAGELFDSDERGHCVVLRPDLPGGVEARIPDGLEGAARTAVDNCPEDALTLAD